MIRPPPLLPPCPFSTISKLFWHQRPYLLTSTPEEQRRLRRRERPARVKEGAIRNKREAQKREPWSTEDARAHLRRRRPHQSRPQSHLPCLLHHEFTTSTTTLAPTLRRCAGSARMSRHEENHAFRLPTEHAFRHRTEAFSALPSPRLERCRLRSQPPPNRIFLLLFVYIRRSPLSRLPPRSM